jgi:hypothetical protein
LFLEKFMTLLSHLSDAFPQYDAIVSHFDGNPPDRLRKHIEGVYHDLFEFLHLSLRVFIASSGSMFETLSCILPDLLT